MFHFWVKNLNFFIQNTECLTPKVSTIFSISHRSDVIIWCCPGSVSVHYTSSWKASLCLSFFNHFQGFYTPGAVVRVPRQSLNTHTQCHEVPGGAGGGAGIMGSTRTLRGSSLIYPGVLVTGPGPGSVSGRCWLCVRRAGRGRGQ